LMVTGPPYGIELDSEWRNRAGLHGCGPAEASYMKKRTSGHTETTISGDTGADWSDEFALVPSLKVGYVWHAGKFTSEVLARLLRNRLPAPPADHLEQGQDYIDAHALLVQHEPCWYVRKKNAPWFGKAGENSTIWDSPSRSSSWAAPTNRSSTIPHSGSDAAVDLERRKAKGRISVPAHADEAAGGRQRHHGRLAGLPSCLHGLGPLATDVSAIAANLPAPERASGSDVQQTSATSGQNKAETTTSAANAHTGSAGPVSL
jgi:hypothetical protein